MALFKPQLLLRTALSKKQVLTLFQDSTACFSSTTPTSRHSTFSSYRVHQPAVSVLTTSTSNTCCTPSNNLCSNPLSLNKQTVFTLSKVNYSSSSSDKNDKGIQVYEARAKGLLRRVKIFSLATSVVGLCCQPYLWYTMQDMSLLFAAPLFTAVNFFVFANPIMIHYLAKRYVNEVYYNPKTEAFTATILSFFALKKSFTFTADDVVVPEIPGLFSMLVAKGKPLFVDDRDFTSIEVYKKMMGFDKPLDLTYVAEGSQQKD